MFDCPGAGLSDIKMQKKWKFNSINLMNKLIGIMLFTILVLFSQRLTAETHPELESIIKCGTFMPDSERIALNQRLHINVLRSGMQKAYPSKLGKFLIHYDTTGINAVPLEDNDSNGIPDYIDMTAYYFDYAYKVEVDSMGYLPPPADDMLGGSDAYDVYCLDIGNNPNGIGYYGLTFKDTDQEKKSYIEIDNNFSPLDSMILSSGKKRTFKDTGMAALKITAAHEFHHGIQYAYGAKPESHSFFAEMTSTWMEYRVYPDTKDYMQYVNDLFRFPYLFPFGTNEGDKGYYWSLFCQYINNNYGERPVKRLWELIAKSESGYTALDSALIESGSGLVSNWCKFLPWLYYTGSRSIEGKYFDHAEEFPEIRVDTLKFSKPSIMMSGTTKSFQIKSYKCILPVPQPDQKPDELDIITSNTDLFSAIKNIASNKEYDLCIAQSPAAGFRQLGNTSYYYQFTPKTGDVVDSVFFSNGELISANITAFPNPYLNKKYNVLYFPVPKSAGLNDIAVLTVLTSDMAVIFSNNISVTEFKKDNNTNIRVLRWNASENSLPVSLNDLASGPYIFTVKFKEDTIIGKFLVQH